MVCSVAGLIKNLCRGEKMDTGPKNSQTMKLEQGKSQVPCWEEIFVVLLVPCFAGSQASAEMREGGGKGKKKRGKGKHTFLSALL